MIPKFSKILSLFFFLTVLLSFSLPAEAKVDNGFSRPYGLLVHNANQDRFVPKIKALNVLMKYFEVKAPEHNTNKVNFKDIDVKSRAYHSVLTACQIDLIDCSGDQFNPTDNVSQKDFLDWFFKLKYADQPMYLFKKYPLLLSSHLRNWLEARRLNLLEGNDITYKVFQEFLYRHKVVEANLNHPFREGLMLNYDEINARKYHDIREIDLILDNFSEILLGYDGMDKLSVKRREFIKNIQQQQDAFIALRESLVSEPYIIRERPDLDPEVTRAVRKYSLQDVLESYTYDYSTNAPYRQHNLRTGVMKMNGKVFMPGSEINYWKLISDQRLHDFKYGWVIAQGVAQWQFGGGICGSSSMVFVPAWKAGLEVLERKNHSIYYSDLYPIENIGLDATVYRPKPNMRFRNSSDSPIVFSVVDDKENKTLTVEIIGNKKYKNIEIEGPIFDTKRDVKWIRHLEDYDGNIVTDVLESHYNSIH